MELKINVISRLFNKSSDYTVLAGKSVKIPKLTPAKYKALLERVESLPAIISAIASTWREDDAVTVILAGIDRGLDEVVELVAILADVDAALLHEEADLSEISEFIRLTIEKNDLQRALKNFRAVLGHFRANPGPVDGS